MREKIIQLQNLTKKYNEFIAVDQLSLEVEKGEIFGLLGPNGAGKSTTILMMLGLTEPTSGSVQVCGINSTRNPILVKQKVGYLPDDVGFYEDMSGLENLIYTARLNRLPEPMAKERAQELVEGVGLLKACDQKAGTYSRGMRQRLGLADVLIKNPEVIILDEPTLGIDPEGVRDLLQLIQTLSKKEGITVLLSSHQLHQVQQICDRVGLFVRGQLIAQGDIDRLSEQLLVKEPVAIQACVEDFPESLAKNLQDIPGVSKVLQTDGVFEIGCATDLTALIAKTIITCGASLLSLSKKEYGLDEIYHRYFEGGANG